MSGLNTPEKKKKKNPPDLKKPNIPSLDSTGVQASGVFVKLLFPVLSVRENLLSGVDSLSTLQQLLVPPRCQRCHLLAKCSLWLGEESI